MRERPIIMTGPSVRAILAGTKTQTRRVVSDPGGALYLMDSGLVHPLSGPVRCPYGVPGDRLWLREGWRVGKSLDHLPGSKIPPGRRGRIEYAATPDSIAWANRGRYRHARFMPRWASRLTLEVTEVRVQRLQEISEEDAKAEGCDGYVFGHGPITHAELLSEPGYMHPRFYRAGFEYLWESINGRRAAWASNPWVWCIGFRRIS